MAVLTNPTDLARETLKLLATRRIAPTPENYQRYYHEIAGTGAHRDSAEERLGERLREVAKANPALVPLTRLTRLLDEGDLGAFTAQLVAIASGREAGARQDWGVLLRELLRSLDVRQTGGSLARKKDGLERLLIHFGSDPQLFDKLQGLMRSWSEVPEATATVVELDPEPPAALAPVPAVPAPADSTRQIKELLALTLEMGMAARLERFPQLADEARVLAHTAREARGVEAWTRLAAQLRQFFFNIEVRGETDAELLDALLRLLGLLVNNIAELVEDDKWLSGQVAVIREVINEPLTTERIAEAERRFKEVVYKQSMLKHSLHEAKHTLKNLIGLFVSRLSELTESTTDYHHRVEGYAGRLESADDILTLKTIVDELMTDTRSMQMDMTRYRDEIVEARRNAEQAQGQVRKLEAELEHVSEQVSQDQLTGVLNRRGLDEAMQREMARAERRKSGLCVAVLDLDNFKKLNDTFGHQAGDDALIHLTKVVRKTLRPTDTVARYGGEEFIILFSETDLEQAVLVMRRLQRELTKRFFLHNNERLLITFSAGVAMLAPGESQDALFARADKAMYQAKVQGKNRVVSAEQP
jgi:diguanylate cyclase